ncbi:MAG TPA: hypothetical protein ACFCUY_01210 [Xenococcaceae cyanobacterium]|jgi:hypothetical protein
MINTSLKTQDSDRYWFKDYQEVIHKQDSLSSPTHSLCSNCSDYYDVPPCQTNLTTDGGCFPSLVSPDRN